MHKISRSLSDLYHMYSYTWIQFEWLIWVKHVLVVKKKRVNKLKPSIHTHMHTICKWKNWYNVMHIVFADKAN